MEAICPNCSHQLDGIAATSNKLAHLAIGATVGASVMRHPAGILLGAIAAHVIEEFIVREVVPVCPVCGLALEIVATNIGGRSK